MIIIWAKRRRDNGAGDPAHPREGGARPTNKRTVGEPRTRAGGRPHGRATGERIPDPKVRLAPHLGRFSDTQVDDILVRPPQDVPDVYGTPLPAKQTTIGVPGGKYITGGGGGG